MGKWEDKMSEKVYCKNCANWKYNDIDMWGGWYCKIWIYHETPVNPREILRSYKPDIENKDFDCKCYKPRLSTIDKLKLYWRRLLVGSPTYPC